MVRRHAMVTLSALAVAGCSVTTAREVVQGDVAFVDVSVVPMDRPHVLAHHTVVVKDGRIAAMAPSASLAVADGTRTIDGAGRFLMPGLAEMHAHLGGPPPPNPNMEGVLTLYLANGVTTVRAMAAGPPQLQWRDQIAKGAILGPDLFVASPSLTGKHTVPAEAAQLVRQWAADGYDLVKLREDVSVEVFDAAVAAAREARIPIGGHVSDFVGLRRTLAARPETLDHLDNYVEDLVPPPLMTRKPGRGEMVILAPGEVVDKVDESGIPEFVRLTKESGTYLSPTMIAFETYFGGKSGTQLLAEHPEARYVSPRERQSWLDMFTQDPPMWHPDQAANRRVLALRQKILQELHRAGVPIILGADTPGPFKVAGFASLLELKYLVEKGGFTPYEALETATRRVAESVKAPAEFGTVAVGRRANLVLLTANPLENIDHAAKRAGVMIRGRWLSEEDLQARLAQIASKHAQPAEGKASTGSYGR